MRARPARPGRSGDRLPAVEPGILDRTFRLFVSSTFGGFEAERNALQARVFGSLRTLCAARGFLLQVVDLRWGVGEQAGRAHDTMRICLGEMARAKASGLEPYVLAMLGDRYGWRPLPAGVPADVFARIARRVRPSAARVLSRGYRLDRNASPHAFMLKPAGRGWPAVERSLRAAFDEAIETGAIPARERWRYGASATEQELIFGALVNGSPGNSMVAVLRRAARTGGRAERTTSDPDARRLRSLRQRVTAHAGRHAIELDAPPATDDAHAAYLDRLVKVVETRLGELLLAQMNALGRMSALDEERASHHAFAVERGALLLGRDEVMQTFERGLAAQSARPLMLVGPPGSGKSAVLARLATTMTRDPARSTIVRFCGLTPASNSVTSLLTALCQEIAHRFGFAAVKRALLAAARGSSWEVREARTAIEADFAIPTEPAALARTLRKFCARIPAKRSVVLVIDAIDQLTGPEAASSAWLPLDLPDHVHLVVSIASDADPARSSHLARVAERVDLPALPATAAAGALDVWLGASGRTLQPAQRARVLAAADASGTPLHLKLLAERAKAWASWHKVPALPASAEQAIRGLFEELGNDARHGRTLVHRTLALIAAGRRGLTEDELADVLGRDEEVMAEFWRRSPDSPRVNALPPIVLSRLVADLSPYLTTGRAEGAPVLRFFHRQFTQIVESSLLSGQPARERHLALARHFSRPTEIIGPDGSRAPDRRAITELPFQLARAGSWPELQATLTDAGFLATKVAVDGPVSALVDFELASPASVPDPAALSELAAAIRLSITALARRPAEIATQVAGRLLGTPHPVISSLIGNLAERERLPALRPLVASWWSAGEPLVRTIETGTGPIVDGVVAGDRIITATKQGAVQVWDLDTGFEILRVTHPTKELLAAAIAPDGTFCVTAGHEGTLHVWDLATGIERGRIHDVGKHIDRVRLTLDQKRVLTVCFRTVAVWPLTGDHRAGSATLPEYGHRIDDAIETRGGRVVAGAYDGSIVVFERGQDGSWTPRPVKAHKGQVTRLALLADGSVVSAGRDGKVHVWDPALRAPAQTLDAKEEVYPLSLVETADAEELIVGTTTGRVDVWRRASGSREMSVNAHKHWVSGVGRSPDATRLVSLSSDGTARVWDCARLASAAAATSEIDCHQDHVTRIAITRDGMRAVSASADRTLIVWDLATGRAVQRLHGHEGWIQDLAVFADGRRAVSTSSDGTLRVWDLERGRQTRSVDRNKDPLHAVAITPDETTVVASFQVEDGQDTLYGVHHFDTATWRWKALQLDDHERTQASYAASGRLAITSDGRFALAPEPYVAEWSVWRLSDRKMEHLHIHCRGRVSRAIAAGDSCVVVAFDDGSIERLDLAAGRSVATLVKQTGGRGRGLDVSADGRLIVCDTADQGFAVWSARQGTLLARATADASVTACAISPDGRSVAAGDQSGRVYLMRFVVSAARR